MGCSYSKSSFSPNDKFVGQNKICYDILLDLGISSEDIDIFYIAFSDIDANSSGFVRIDELTSYFKIPENSFTSYIFEIFDFKKVHELNFIQFCFSIWNFLSSFDIALFCFKIADKALELTISVNELKYALEVIHNCKLEKSFLYPLYKSFVGTLKDSLTVKLQSFLDWCEKNSAIIGPVYVLQKLFRTRILGESYWVKTAVNRTNNPNTSDYKYTLSVIEQLKKIDNDHNTDLEKNEFYNKSKNLIGIKKDKGLLCY